MFKRFAVLALSSALLLTACSGGGATPTPEPVSQFYADPANGLDTNLGTQAKPIKTLKEALLRMGTGAVKTTILLAGTYSEASGESWSYTIPDGITLKGNSAGVILQSSTKKAGFTLNTGSTLSDLTLTGFDTVLSASSGTQTLTRLTFKDNQYDLKLSGSAASSVQDSNSSGAYTAIQAAGLSTVSVQGGSLGGTRDALTLQQSASASLTNTDIGSGGFDVGGSSTLSLNNTKVHDVDGYVIYVRDSSTRLNIEGGSFYNNKGNAAIVLSSGIVDIKNASFSASNIAINADGGSVTLIKSTVVNNASYGIALSKGVAFKMRGSTVAGNTNGSNAIGISISDATKGIDMGTASDPGGNTIKDNGSSTNPNLSVSGSPATVQVVGNTWNANAQGADATGHYPSKLVSTTNAYESGRNYYFPRGIYLQF